MKDTGNYEVTEVPQLYVRDKVGSVTRPVKGSKRILKLGEKRTVSFELSMRELAKNEEGKRSGVWRAPAMGSHRQPMW